MIQPVLMKSSFSATNLSIYILVSCFPFLNNIIEKLSKGWCQFHLVLPILWVLPIRCQARNDLVTLVNELLLAMDNSYTSILESASSLCYVWWWLTVESCHPTSETQKWLMWLCCNSFSLTLHLECYDGHQLLHHQHHFLWSPARICHLYPIFHLYEATRVDYKTAWIKKMAKCR